MPRTQGPSELKATGDPWFLLPVPWPLCQPRQECHPTNWEGTPRCRGRCSLDSPCVVAALRRETRGPSVQAFPVPLSLSSRNGGVRTEGLRWQRWLCLVLGSGPFKTAVGWWVGVVYAASRLLLLCFVLTDHFSGSLWFETGRIRRFSWGLAWSCTPGQQHPKA